MELKFETTGFSEARKVLNKMPQRLQTRVMRSAIMAQAKVIKKAVLRNAPTDDGTQSKASKKYGRLRENIRAFRLKREPKGVALARVDLGNPKSRSFWGHFLEFGTRFIAPRRWFTSAVDSSTQESITKMKDIMGRGIEREAEKLAGEYKSAKKSLR